MTSSIASVAGSLRLRVAGLAVLAASVAGPIAAAWLSPSELALCPGRHLAGCLDSPNPATPPEGRVSRAGYVKSVEIGKLTGEVAAPLASQRGNPALRRSPAKVTTPELKLAVSE